MCTNVSGGGAKIPATTTATTSGSGAPTSAVASDVAGASGTTATAKGSGPTQHTAAQGLDSCGSMHSKVSTTATSVGGAGGGAVKGVVQLGGRDAIRTQLAELLALLQQLVAKLQDQVGATGGGPKGTGVGGAGGPAYGPNPLQHAFVRQLHMPTQFYPAIPSLAPGGPLPLPVPKGSLPDTGIGGAKGTPIFWPDPMQVVQVGKGLPVPAPVPNPGPTPTPTPTPPAPPTPPVTSHPHTSFSA